jgi:cytochrome c biogenesis protein CcdA
VYLILEFLKEFRSFILGLIFIIGGFLSFSLIGITLQLFGENMIRHYLLVAIGLILIIFGIISMYFFIKKDGKSLLKIKEK